MTNGNGAVGCLGGYGGGSSFECEVGRHVPKSSANLGRRMCKPTTRAFVDHSGSYPHELK